MAAAHLGHHHIGEEKINLGRAAAGQETLRIIAMRSFQNFIAKTAQDADGKMPHSDFILDDEDGLGPGGIFSLAGFAVSGGGRRRDAGQKNAKGAAAPRLALDPNVTVALPNDPVSGGETEAAVARFILGGEEWLEEPRLDL